MAKSGPRRNFPTGEGVRDRLIGAAIAVLARDGFAQASARAIASEAGGANGLIFYHFGSMDQLLAEVATVLGQRRIERVRAGFGGDDAPAQWASRLSEVIRTEASSPEGRAVLELVVGARASPVLAEAVARAVDASVAFAEAELARVLAGSPVLQIVPARLLAEMGTAAFFGLEVLVGPDPSVDINRIAGAAELALSLAGRVLGPSS
jgi:AcrR family transcriptional regulator